MKIKNENSFKFWTPFPPKNAVKIKRLKSFGVRDSGIGYG